MATLGVRRRPTTRGKHEKAKDSEETNRQADTRHEKLTLKRDTPRTLICLKMTHAVRSNLKSDTRHEHIHTGDTTP